MFQVTTAIRKLSNLKKRTKVIQGGTWGGKTYGIVTLLIDYATKNAGKKITVVAETIPAVKEGALSDFLDIMQETGRFYEPRFNRNELTYRFNNGTRVQFKSFDTAGKAKAAGKRDVLFINEAQYISYNIADTLIMRTEGDIWIDYNPDTEFWVHEEIIPNSKTDFIILNYKDNEALPDTIMEQINERIIKAETSGYWANWVKVYVDGRVGSIQGTVFDDFETVDEIPKEATFVAYGLDFGFTNDPSALVEVYKFDSALYVNEIIYETRLTNDDILERAKKLIDIRGITVADSAEPKSIEHLSRKGWNVVGAKKGPDSIKAGIDTLQSHKLRVTNKSTNLIKELRAYKWDTDKDGKSLNKPIDDMNHAIDALRYVALNKLSARNETYPKVKVITPNKHRRR